ncbi:MAG: rod shape-determining protein MreC [Parcubacteria group bacterium]|nr:rod shape-determining protein MreC [Parcubacteria group bacterium]
MLQGNREKTKLYVKRTALIAVLIFILWYASLVVRPLEAGAVSVSGIFWNIGVFIAERFSAAGIFFKDKQNLVEENTELQNALRIAKTQTLVYEAVIQENEELKRLLGREDVSRGILGRVLSQPNRSPYDIFYIDIGKDRDIITGSLVISGNVLLGVVDTVYAHSAKIRLFSSPDTETHAVISKKKISATAYGQGGGVFEIKIPRDIEIAAGDAVMYPSIHNYLLGTVLKIESKSTSSFQSVFFRAPINIFTTQFVLVTDDLILKIEEQE